MHDEVFGEVTFEGFMQIANDTGYSTTDKGLSILYDVFKHLSEGGTLDNIPKSNGEVITAAEATAMLSVAWLDVRNFNLVKAEANEEF